MRGAGHMGERAGREDDVVGAQSEELGGGAGRRVHGVGRVHDTLHRAARARGVQDQRRVVGCDGVLARRRVALLPRGVEEHLLERHRAGGRRVTDHDAMPQCRDAGIGVAERDPDLRTGRFEHLAQFAVAQRREARRDDRAHLVAGEVERCQHPPVGQVDHDHVTAPDAQRAQRAGEPRGVRGQLGVRQRAYVLAGLVGDDRRMAGPVTCGPVEVVEERLRPPPALGPKAVGGARVGRCQRVPHLRHPRVSAGVILR